MKITHLRFSFFLSAIVISQVIIGCSPMERLTTTNPPEPANTATQLSTKQAPTVNVTQTPGTLATSTPPNILLFAFPTPRVPISSSVVQDNPFTFDIRFYRDAMFGKNPVAPSLYSDMEGIGIYFTWEYQGPGLPPPATVYWGIDPNINALLQQYEYQTNGIKDGDSNGWMGGITLPSGSKVGDQLEALVRIDTGGKSYGAVIQFYIRQGTNGFEPGNVTVESIGNK